jgi:hypothetical protein
MVVPAGTSIVRSAEAMRTFKLIWCAGEWVCF